jgi:hypothetical protein
VSRDAAAITDAGGVHSELGLAGAGRTPLIDGGECTHAALATPAIQMAAMTGRVTV